MGFPRWTQMLEGRDYTIIVVPEGWALVFAEALNYARHEGRGLCKTFAPCNAIPPLQEISRR